MSALVFLNTEWEREVCLPDHALGAVSVGGLGAVEPDGWGWGQLIIRVARGQLIEHSRLVSVMFRTNLAASEPETPETKPESKPPDRGSQGFANDDWETVCFVPGVSKTKVTVSLTFAVMVLGLKKRPLPVPLLPTWTCKGWHKG